jgi:hypothetical protein
MTSETSTHPTATHKTAKAKPAKARPVNLVEILAGTLSAVSTAVAASFLGVTGTIVGAVVGSVLGTIATAFYTHSLTLGHDRLRALRPRPVTRGGATAPTTTGTVYGRRVRRRWPLVVGPTAAAFALAIAGITTAELAFGHPVSNLFGGHATGTTTITTVSSGNGTGGTPADTGTPVPTTSAGTDASTGPSATTTVAPTDPEPTTAPDTAATAPAGQPTTAATPTQP